MFQTEKTISARFSPKSKLSSNCSFFLKDVKYDEEGKIKKVEIIMCFQFVEVIMAGLKFWKLIKGKIYLEENNLSVNYK